MQGRALKVIVVLVCFAQSWAVLWTWHYDVAVPERGELLTCWAILVIFF